MAKLLAVIMISMLVKVECTANEILLADECSCSGINSNFDSIQNTLDDLKEQLSRKGLTTFINFFSVLLKRNPVLVLQSSKHITKLGTSSFVMYLQYHIYS